MTTPPNVQAFSASGSNVDELQDQLFKQSQGQELFYQTVENEDGSVTVHGFPRGQVLDLIYERAYPVVKLLDNRAVLKVKSNRAVSEFFIIIQSRRPGNFIGKHGQTLDAAENVITHSVSRVFPRWVTINVDIDNYRRKRQAYLENAVRRLVRDIERDHRERPVEGLLPKERKFVHQFFASHPYLTTESRGEGLNRTLFILPRSDIQEV
jgi:predicted RNA-binding protein Jag